MGPVSRPAPTGVSPRPAGPCQESLHDPAAPKQHPALTPNGAPTGTEQYGGPIITAGGLIFIAATQDAKFRAFDKATGKLIWETSLPAAGFATPSTYAVRGKQYVVIAAGGGKLGTTSGDAYVAYSLP